MRVVIVKPAGGGVVVNFYSPFHSLADVLAETLELPFPCQRNDKKVRCYVFVSLYCLR